MASVRAAALGEYCNAGGPLILGTGLTLSLSMWAIQLFPGGPVWTPREAFPASLPSEFQGPRGTLAKKIGMFRVNASDWCHRSIRV